MNIKKKYPKTVKKYPRAAKKQPGKPKQDNAPGQPDPTSHFIEEFISANSTPALSADEFIPNEWPAFNPGRTRIVRGAIFSPMAADSPCPGAICITSETVTAASLGPGEDTVLFVECMFDLIDEISFNGVRPMFYKCRLGHIPRGISSDRPMTMKECQFENEFPLTGRSANARLYLEDTEEKHGGRCWRIIDFPSVSVKNSSPGLHIINCDNVSFDGIVVGTDNDVRIEYHYPDAAERDLHTHTLKFANCNFESTVQVQMNHSLVSIDFVDSFLDFLSLSKGTIRHIGFDKESFVNSMEAFECHFVESYPATQATTFHIRCSGEFRSAPLTIYKKVRYFPWYFAPLAGCERFNGTPVVAELLVPPHAERHIDHDTGKIRVSEAEVVGFYKIKPLTDDSEFHKFEVVDFYKTKPLTDDSEFHKFVPFVPFGTLRSTYDRGYAYREGDTVVPKLGFERSNLTCASGIHGFISMEDAANY